TARRRKKSCGPVLEANAKSRRDWRVERAVPCALLKFGRRRRQLFWHRLRSSRSTLATFWQVGVKKTKHMRALDRADAFLFLQIGNALPERFHFRPVHFGPEMVLGMIAVVEEEPVIDFAVAAHAPGNRFVGV